MNEGKLKKELLDVAYGGEKRTYAYAELLTHNEVFKILNNAKADILRKIKEHEYEDIPDDIIKEKIIEWFGDEE